MKKQKTKGNFRYIKSRKRRQGLLSILMFAIALGIFVLGLFLNKFDKANIFTVLAVLMILPSAKMLISFIILVPFHSSSEEAYQKVKQALNPEVTLYTDMVFTSPEKVMMLDFLAIDHHYLIGYASQCKHVDYMKKYLQENLKIRDLNYQVEIIEDFDRFVKRIDKLTMTKEQETKERKELIDYIRSLMV